MIRKFHNILLPKQFTAAKPVLYIYVLKRNFTQNATRKTQSVAMGSIGEERRTYPLKKPPGHRPPVPRWSLKLPREVSHLHTVYVGVQCHNGHTRARKKAEEAVDAVLHESITGGPVVDTFRVTNGFDLEHSRVWVAYWTNAESFKAVLSQLDPTKLWRNLGDDMNDVGVWVESFSAPIERLETNYSRLDHKPGLAQLPNTEQPAHETTAYWGAGRDRIPASAHDLFPLPKNVLGPTSEEKGFGERLTGTNYDNMCHIRSGQWWELCDDEEREAYEGNLQGKLMGGMNYLWNHPEETGTIGLRFLQNLNKQGQPIKETCGAGFHKNWKDLEKWSSRHPSHLAIFNGAMAHAKRFGENRKLMTWHEVWILKQGEARFEYVNCDPKTGVIKWVNLDREPLTV